ncbi:hypothetical protein OPV22_027864 [Ensete ventricosum]|uniref:Uncharacterized protein n=1 Tax=Ensete ventricosum TaxID=4639 RepID=A0AAV8P5U2_ENSVE|nr:hypothetical protein OPV22_027864 [Ensete ventricosum]
MYKSVSLCGGALNWSLKTGSNWNMIGKWDIRERTTQICRTLCASDSRILLHGELQVINLIVLEAHLSCPRSFAIVIKTTEALLQNCFAWCCRAFNPSDILILLFMFSDEAQ